MKTALKIWLAFAVCVLLLAAVLTWIAVRTVHMEQERDAALAKLESGQIALTIEEKVNSAFWRIDSLMSMLISQESSRDPADYLPFRIPVRTNTASGQAGEAGSESRPQPSPLLESPSDLIRLHFQINPDGSLNSPQSPQGSVCDQAVDCGVSLTNIQKCESLLGEAKLLVSYDVACLVCPSTDKTEFLASKPWIAEQNRPGPLGNNLSASQSLPLWAVVPTVSESELEDGSRRTGNFQDAGAAADMMAYAQSRSNMENESRAKYSQNVVMNASIDNVYNRDGNGDQNIRVGMMRPVWIKDQLLLVRRVEASGKPVVQCCWLNWERLDEFLKAEIADLFPGADFVAVTDVGQANPTRTSTTLPIQLVLPTGNDSTGLMQGADKARGGLWPALLTAGAMTLFASLALAVLLAGVMRLSERRATFVSAVSHELRTPLTTFRIYSEMLADGMVSDPQQREEYIQTLKSESERLGHLVDNVLVYAGLENRANQTARQLISVSGILERVSPVLERSVERHPGLQWKTSVDASLRGLELHTDIQAVERVLVNLTDNAIKYGRSGTGIEIRFSVFREDRFVVFEISDRGEGIPAGRRQKLFRAFSRSDSESAGSAPGVGLGLALCKRIAADLGGKLVYEPGNPGSRFQLWLPVRK